MKTKNKDKWKPIYLVKIYQMTKVGLSKKEISKSLKVSEVTLWAWENGGNGSSPKEGLKEAIAMAEKERDTGDFADWVYEQLSPDLKKLWDQIEEWEKEDNGIAKIELMLQDQGKKVRQRLFLHALVTCSFCPSLALKKVNVSKREFDRWINEDLGFADLIKEIEWHKGNFFEEGVTQLVRQRHPGVVMFANRTYNKNRGYGQTIDVNQRVSGSVTVGVLDLTELLPFLSDDQKVALLEAVRKCEAKKETLTVTDQLNNQISTLPALEEAV